MHALDKSLQIKMSASVFTDGNVDVFFAVDEGARRTAQENANRDTAETQANNPLARLRLRRRAEAARKFMQGVFKKLASRPPLDQEGVDSATSGFGIGPAW